MRYYVMEVHTNGPREDGVKFLVPVRGRPDFKEVDHYRSFHVKKETFIWEEDERYGKWKTDILESWIPPSTGVNFIKVGRTV